MTNYPDWALNRLLTMLNGARSAQDILSNPVLKDDPQSGHAEGGYIIGETVAERLISHRQGLARYRYSSAEDILSVPGLGADKLNDLLHSFHVSADAAFLVALRQPNGPLYDNWIVEGPSQELGDADMTVLQNGGLDFLRLAVARLLPSDDPRQGHLRGAYVATYPEAHPASYHFANWWYGFDQDNWFGYAQMQQLCENYLGYYAPGSARLIFGFVHLYDPRHSPLNAVRPAQQIPFVVNEPERKLTVWRVELND